MNQGVNVHNNPYIKLNTWWLINIHKISNKLPQKLMYRSRVDLPEAILLSCAAGPSLRTFFTWRNSSGRSPPMMVKPKPWGLFFRVVRKIAPCSWDGSRVNPLKPVSSKRGMIEIVCETNNLKLVYKARQRVCTSKWAVCIEISLVCQNEQSSLLKSAWNFFRKSQHFFSTVTYMQWNEEK